MEELIVSLDADARQDIADELGSVNTFIGRLSALVERESGGQASLAQSAAEGARGGGLIEISTAVSGLIAALSPIVIVWIRSRGFDVEEKTETTKTGKMVRTVRVRKGTRP